MRGARRAWLALIGIWFVPARSAADDGVGEIVSTAGPAAAPTPGAARPRLVVVRTAERPHLDGHLGDPAWAKATPSSSFTQKFPNEAQAPSEPTELRVLYDDSALYIAFDCVQAGVPVKERLARRDRQVESDWVQVAIDDGANAYEFSVNAAGVLGDGVRFNDTEYSADWDGVWDAQVARSEKGWSVEMRIPLRIFRHPSGIQEWGFQARRYISLRQETNEWAFIPRSVAGEVSHYGRLSSLGDVRRSNPFELLPYVSAGIDWADLTPGGGTFGDFGYQATAGLDLSWRLGKGLTLDASFNPDFSQVEADQLLLNLTTYETFTPEKRPFFIKGMSMFQVPRMGLFSSPQTLFYTRRIGAAPDAPALGGGLTGEVAAPSPSTIYAAGKLGGRLTSRVTAGVVSAVTGRNDVPVTMAGAPTQELLADPLTLANVARIKVDVGRGTTLGLLATALQRFEPDDEYPTMPLPDGTPGQQCPGGAVRPAGARCFHDGYVASLDGSWRSASGTYLVAGQGIVTAIDQGPDRTMPDGTVIGSGDVSPSGRLYLAKEGGQWRGSIDLEGVGRRVDYNDLGYLQRQNHLRLLPFVAYRTLEPFWKIAETETRVYASARNNLDGLELLRGYYGGGKVRFHNFWTVAADLYRYQTRFEDRDVGDGTALERPPATGLDVSLSTDPRRQLAAAFSSESVIYPEGASFTLSGEITYQPLSRLELQLLPQLVRSSGEQRYVSGTRQDGMYLFGALKARSVGGTLRASYAFTNQLTLQVYGQLLLIAEHYSDFRSFLVDPAAPRPVIRRAELIPTAAPAESPDRAETSLNLNAVLRWEFRPGSTLFLVFSRFQSPDLALDGEPARLELGALRRGPAVDALRLKLSYYWN